MTFITSFSKYLQGLGMSEPTILSYTYAVRLFLSLHKSPTTESLLAFKGWLIENCNPRTANLRINGVNAWLRSLGKSDLRLRTIKVQHRQWLDNVISDADYRKLKRTLKAEGRMMLYYAVWTMAATGARVSELLRFRLSHYRQGFIDIVGKGGKCRRIFIPAAIGRDIAGWLGDNDRLVYLNRFGKPITARWLAREIERCARRYGIDAASAHPHAFRHRFALNFLERYKDIALLADLLGHSSIETTRIYLRRSAEEQRRFLDAIVDW